MKKQHRRSAALLLALALALSLVLTGCSGGSPVTVVSEAQSKQEVTVNASSSVSLAPDKAAISFGVTNQDTTVEDAQNANSEAVNHVIEVLTENGVEKKSIRTTYYSLYPQYDYNTGEPRITGYSVSTTMSVSDQNVEDLGKLISTCLSAGINTVNDISFSCSGYDEAYAQALEEAVANARTKAEKLAAASGKTLGDVVSVSEGWQDTSERYGYNGGMGISMDVEEGAGSADIQPGESQITANVTVTFQLQ